MAIEVRFDTERALIVFEVDHSFSDRDLMEGGRTLQAHPDLDKARGGLLDLTRVADIALTRAGIEELVAAALRGGSALKGFRMAIVAPDDIGFGMARMYELRRDDGGANRVFRNIEEAQEWLASPADDPRTRGS